MIIHTINHQNTTTPTETRHITVQVIFPDGTQPLFFKLSKTTKLIKICDTIAENYGISRDGQAFRLQFLGETLILDGSTPEDMGMEDGACIYLFWIKRLGTAVGPEGGIITIGVKLPGKIEPLTFKIDKTSKLGKIYDYLEGSFRDRGIQKNFKLNFLGQTLVPHQTSPRDMDMEEGDFMHLVWADEPVPVIEPPRPGLTLRIKQLRQDPSSSRLIPDENDGLSLKVRPTATFKYIYQGVAKYYGVSEDGKPFRLVFDDRLIHPNDSTPKDMGLEDQDCVHLMWIAKPGAVVAARRHIITLAVKLPDNSEPSILKVKATTKMITIYNAVAKQFGVSGYREYFRLIFKGQYIRPDHLTIHDLKMEDKDRLDFIWVAVPGQ